MGPLVWPGGWNRARWAQWDDWGWGELGLDEPIGVIRGRNWGWMGSLLCLEGYQRWMGPLV